MNSELKKFIEEDGRVINCPSNVSRMTVHEYMRYFGWRNFARDIKYHAKTLWSAFKGFIAFPIILFLSILYFCGMGVIVQYLGALKSIREEKKFCDKYKDKDCF